MPSATLKTSHSWLAGGNQSSHHGQGKDTISLSVVVLGDTVVFPTTVNATAIEVEDVVVHYKYSFRRE